MASYIQNLLNQGKSERSINRIVISLRNFYSYLKSQSLIQEVPKIEYKSSKNNRKLPQILTIEEVDKIIRIVEKDCPKGIRDNALLELMYATGMKVSELINLNVEDVNLELNFVRCTDNKHYERIIPIGRSACKALSEYLSIRYKIAQCGVSNLFVNLNGNKLTRQGIWRIVKEYSRKAGIDKELGQYFAALTNMRLVGVMGDERTYDYAVVLRAVTTSDFMTAESADLPWEVLGKVTTRIVNEVKGVNRVMYDCTGKPPATIEFE